MAPSKDFEFPSYTKKIYRSVYPAIDPSNESNSAAGKVVLITGGGTGVGKLIAKAFITAGAKTIALLGRREDILASAKKDLQAAAGSSTEILTFPADVLDDSALQAAFAATAHQAGPIDITIANAGYLPTPIPAATADITDYWRAFEVNTKGTLLTLRAFTHHLNSAGKPVFISISTSALNFLGPSFSHYATSKLATAHLITFLQAENPSIRCVSMHPGVIESDMNAKSGMPVSKDDASLPGAFSVWLACNGDAEGWTGGRFFWCNWDVEELVRGKGGIVQGEELVVGVRGWARVEGPEVVV